MDRLTPTEQAIYDTLSDGRLHKRDDLMATCMTDELCSRKSFQRHISCLRKKLPKDLIIDAVARSNTIWYRLARSLIGPGD